MQNTVVTKYNISLTKALSEEIPRTQNSTLRGKSSNLAKRSNLSISLTVALRATITLDIIRNSQITLPGKTLLQTFCFVLFIH